MSKGGFKKRKNRTLSWLQRSRRSELTCADLGAAAPQVIAGQIDVLPAERRQVLQQGVIDGMAVATHRVRCTLQINRIPQNDGRRHQVEAAGPVALLLKTAVANFAQAVEEHGSDQLRCAPCP